MSNIDKTLLGKYLAMPSAGMLRSELASASRPSASSSALCAGSSTPAQC